MNRKYRRILTSLFLAVLCALSTTLTSWASGPGEGRTETENHTGVSRVITAGAAGESEGTSGSAVASATTDEANTAATGTKGAFLGKFTTTGYCNCSKCSGGHNLTYSGTVPKAKHTISADITIYPIGTRLMIDDIIYTVEDMGSSVKGNWIDIYYDSHQEAVVHGMKTQEIYAVE